MHNKTVMLGLWGGGRLCVSAHGVLATRRGAGRFAVKFHNDEGNGGLVGNNVPVFFIQNAMKFPDLIHAAKREPHHGMPHAAPAHDTLWDFASLLPKTTPAPMCDKAVKAAGANADFHRCGLWEATDAGVYPGWGLGLHIFTEAQAESFSSDVRGARFWPPGAA